MVDGATRRGSAGQEHPAHDTRSARRDDVPRRETPRHRARIPGFAREGAETGLGDALTRVTAAVGIRPCGGCTRRAAALNRWMAFGGRPHR
jgi:hypothetical protein